MEKADGLVIEPVGSDLVALAQAYALDVSVFPHPSVSLVFGSGAPPSVWVARLEPGGPVVGFVSTVSSRATGRSLEINALAVEASARNRGIGRRLLRAATRAARQRGFSHVSLHVSTGNRPAMHLYEHEGFVEVQRIAGYYRAGTFPDGGAAWHMVKTLR